MTDIPPKKTKCNSNIIGEFAKTDISEKQRLPLIMSTLLPSLCLVRKYSFKEGDIFLYRQLFYSQVHLYL